MAEAPLDGLRFHEIVRLDDPLLPAFLHLYEQAFPPHERDPVADLVRLLHDRARGEAGGDHLLALVDGEEELVGFARYQAPPGSEAAYLPYLAVTEARRGGGLGGRFFCELARRLRALDPPPRALLFEVEDPTLQEGDAHELALRRVGFYQRLGARLLNGVDYVQRVEFHPEGTPMRLMVLPLRETTAQQAFEMAQGVFGDAVTRGSAPLRLEP